MNRLIFFLLLVFSFSSQADIDSTRSCLTEAMLKSRAFKIQDLAINVSVDDNVTFSCKNLTRLDIKELKVIRIDQEKVIEKVMVKLKSGENVRTLDFSRLGTDLGNKILSQEQMCPMIQSSLNMQVTTAVHHTFQKELKRCPSSRDQLRIQYDQILNTIATSNLDIADACQTLVNKISILKENYVSSCGAKPVRHRNKLGTFAIKSASASRSSRNSN